MRRLAWTNTLFLAAAHLLGAAGILHLALRFSPWTLGLGALWLACCGVSVTGGYHRLFAHPTYRGAAWLRLFYLLFGAASVQNSALKWSADHRRHHACTDGEEDPYNIRRGFWWAHIGWVLARDPPRALAQVDDLAADPLVRFQHRFYVPLAALVGAGLPAALALAWGDPLGGLLVAGFSRLVLQYHATFSVNSLAHCLGRRPYSTSTSARDSALTALVTLGEGYHNFHHRFPRDYRNGVRAHHFDPTKWWIWALSRTGSARDLQRTAPERIERARRDALGKAA